MVSCVMRLMLVERTNVTSNPAACQVDPAVSFRRSSMTTSLQPFLARP